MDNNTYIRIDINTVDGNDETVKSLRRELKMPHEQFTIPLSRLENGMYKLIEDAKEKYFEDE